MEGEQSADSAVPAMGGLHHYITTRVTTINSYEREQRTILVKEETLKAMASHFNMLVRTATK